MKRPTTTVHDRRGVSRSAAMTLAAAEFGIFGSTNAQSHRPQGNHTMKTPKGRTTEVPMLYETENDIPRSARSELSALINQRLSDSLDLQLQLKQAHWNVKGPHFFGLHELFDKIAEEVESYVDEIAKRIVQLGGIAQGTVRVATARSRLDRRHGKDHSQSVEYSPDEHRLLSLATMQPVSEVQTHDFHPRWGINE